MPVKWCQISGAGVLVCLFLFESLSLFYPPLVADRPLASRLPGMEVAGLVHRRCRDGQKNGGRTTTHYEARCSF